MGKRMQVITDYHEGPVFEGVADMSFSPDGSRMAYRAQEGRKQYVVAGGRKSKGFDGISGKMGFLFSPDSKHMAAVAVEGKKQILILDGRYSKPYDRIGEVVFSPDSRHYVYSVETSGRWYVIRDGKKVRLSDNVSELTFSPNSLYLTYVAQKNRDTFVIRDVKEYGPFDNATMPVFSPDSVRYAYAFLKAGAWRVAIDDSEGPYLTDRGSLCSALTRHALFIRHTAAENGLLFWTVRNGHPFPVWHTLRLARIPGGWHVRH